MARITRDLVQALVDRLEKEYKFNPNDGRHQVRPWLAIPKDQTNLPKPVAYGAYMALRDLLHI